MNNSHCLGYCLPSFFLCLKAKQNSQYRVHSRALILSCSTAASSFSFCRPAIEYKALPEDFKYQLSYCTGGNLTWHECRGNKTAGGRTVKLLQQPGTETLQVITQNRCEHPNGNVRSNEVLKLQPTPDFIRIWLNILTSWLRQSSFV